MADEENTTEVADSLQEQPEDEPAVTSPTPQALDVLSPRSEPEGVEPVLATEPNTAAEDEVAQAEPVAEEEIAAEPAAEEPVAEQPTAEEPVGQEPASEEPDAEELAAEEPAVEEPATEDPVAEEPATEEPATEEPAAGEPATEEPAADEPATEEPFAEEPATEKPAAEEAATEQPTADEPAAEEPVAEELATEEPTAEEATAGEPAAEEAPADESPAVPAVEEPAAEETATEEPVAEAANADEAPAEPAAEEPAAEEAAVEEPAAEEPAAAELVAQETASEDPAPEESTAEQAIAEEPTAEEPVSAEPTAEEPVAAEAVAEEPIAEEAAVEDPAAEQPATEEPTGEADLATAEEPAAEQPATEETATEEPAAEEQAAEEPAAEEAAADERATGVAEAAEKPVEGDGSVDAGVAGGAEVQAFSEAPTAEVELELTGDQQGDGSAGTDGESAQPEPTAPDSVALQPPKAATPEISMNKPEELDKPSGLKSPMADSAQTSRTGTKVGFTETTPGPSTEPQAQPTKTPKSSEKRKAPPAFNHCLNLVWSFGVNRFVPAINMLYKLSAADPGRDAVFYTCSNVGVLFDFTENTQTLLQGHSQSITCSAVSEDKRWLVTADAGRYASIIVWDTFTAVPVQTIFDPHPSKNSSDTGVIAVAITNDAKYIASCGSAFPQSVHIWDWTSNTDSTPVASVVLDFPIQNSLQSYISFNASDPYQLVSNSNNQVVFYTWNGENLLEYSDPKVTDQDFNRVVGTFSQSIHAPEGKWVYTATSAGNVVVWAPDKPVNRQGAVSSPKLKAFKLVKLQERALTVLTTHNEYIVTGDITGCIKFYDNQLRMINWYQEFDRIGPINSISFAYCPGFPFDRVPTKSQTPTDATIEANKFPVKDFVLSTITSKIGKIQNDGTELIMVQAEHDDAIHAIAAHPSRSHICIASYAGLIKVWDYVLKKVVKEEPIKGRKKVSCVAYDPSGKFIAIGFTDGMVNVVDSFTLSNELVEPFSMSHGGITHIQFSHNSKYLVTADKDMCVVVYKAQYFVNESAFVFFGKRRAHYKPISGIIFGVALDTEFPRLMSVGEDRVLVEYDLANSADDDLKVISTNKIEQSGVPLCLAWYPPVLKEDFLLTANNQYKLKLYNSTTKMCRKTVLGPTYGSPVQKLAVLPYKEDPFSEPRYIAFTTEDKLGLHRLPVLGNPHDAMVTVAHPQGNSNLCCSFDAKYLFTAGGDDATVQMWQVYTPALEASAKLGGDDLVPFYDLIEGGKTGRLFRELEDYFYYAMIRSQGVNTMSKRHVSISIPIKEIPFVIRALGFYPTEQEIDDMLNEVKFSQYVETGKYVTEIDLNTFIKLYVNHRPAFGMNPKQILDAFRNLGTPTVNDNYIIDREEFIEILQNRGEQLNDAEMAEFISVLLGISPEGSVSEFKDFKALEQDPTILENLPVEITADMFSNTILGFPVTPLLNPWKQEPEKSTTRAGSAVPSSAKSVKLVTTTGTQAE